MGEITTEIVREFLKGKEGQIIALKDLRYELEISQGSKSFEKIRWILKDLKKQRLITNSSRRGDIKILKQIKRVGVFSKERERRKPFDFKFFCDRESEMELPVARDIVIREGDLILIGGQSNWGKTAIALNLCGENIDHRPILMGNEYTSIVSDEDEEEHEPSARFYERLCNMDWVEWTNGTGEDKFELYPVKEDYPDYIVKDRINFIDWINLDASNSSYISKLMEQMKARIGRGLVIPVLQKGDNSPMARGGQFTKDFTDCELLIDKFSEHESMITIGKVKEYINPVMGRKFAFGIKQGVRIINLREIKDCPECHTKKYINGKSCERCYHTGYIDKDSDYL